MDETEVYRCKKNPVSEETGQGAAICICWNIENGRGKTRE